MKPFWAFVSKQWLDCRGFRAAWFVTVALFAMQPCFVMGQWSPNPDENTPVCIAQDWQAALKAIPDGYGGATTAWVDFRGGGYGQIYAQRIDEVGITLWEPDGILLSSPVVYNGGVALTSDGAGGSIIVWTVGTFPYADTILAQRINSSGTIQWQPGGVVVCPTVSQQANLVVTSDSGGGAIIAWNDYRSGNSQLYAQRVNSNGVPQWVANGVQVAADSVYKRDLTIISGSSGGAILAWANGHSGSGIYTQRINNSGVAQWAPNGTRICAQLGLWPQLVPGASSGAIIAWHDSRAGSGKVFAQRITGAGAVQWIADGVRLSTDTVGQYNTHLSKDNAGGAIVSWRHGTDVQAQRINTNGVLQWGVAGISLCTSTGNQFVTNVVSDDSGGAVVHWLDERSGGRHLYAQRVNIAGSTLWANDGVPISTASGDVDDISAVTNTEGGTVVVWIRDSFSDADIYAQNVSSDGLLGTASGVLFDIEDVPGDQGGSVTIEWTASNRDFSSTPIITHYAVWRGTGVGPTWIHLGDVTATQSASYQYTAATLGDSNATSVPYNKFYVVAHTANPLQFWQSNTDSGYSVDNIAPSAITALAVSILPDTTVRLVWSANTDSDLRWYAIHRSVSADFAPNAGTLIGVATLDTSYTDIDPSLDTLNFYSVVTVDLHDNNTPSPMVGGAFSSDVHARWNIVSTPFTVPNYLKSVLFPSATSAAFSYQGGFSQQPILENGLGYFLKFPTAQGVPMAGLVRMSDTIVVTAGWNMIGSVSRPVDVGEIATLPEGIIESSFFTYNSTTGFSVVSTIEPGKGYWVKTGQPGYLRIGLPTAQPVSAPVTNPVASFNRMVLRDATGQEAVLYFSSELAASEEDKFELPPAPEGMFTARFGSQSMVAGSDQAILLSSVSYPVEMRWDVREAVHGVGIEIDERRISMETGGSVRIEGPSTSIRLSMGTSSELPTEFALSMNYPNPFNPSTTISYALPVDARVSLEIFNVLGQKVATLIDGVQDAGFKSVQWNADGLASGVYFCKASAVGVDGSKPFSSINKMMLTR